MNEEYIWDWCELCDGPFVWCPKCGNNCCNAGTGTLPDGSRCGCDEAYRIQYEADKSGTAPTKSSFTSYPIPGE